MMAFNTNYKDTGLFGVYAVAKVRSLPRQNYDIFSSLTVYNICGSITCSLFYPLHDKLKLKNLRFIDFN